MIPYVRIVTFLAFLGVLACVITATVSSNPHAFMGIDALLLATASAFFIFSITLHRRFVADLISILWTAYVTQRVIVIYAFPYEIDYYDTVPFTRETIFRTMIFVFDSSLALALGVWAGVSFRRRSAVRRIVDHGAKVDILIPPMKIWGIKASFNNLLVACSLTVIVGFLIKLYTLFVVGTGFIGQVYTSESAHLVRLANINVSLGFIIHLGVVTYWRKIWDHKLILFAVFLLLFTNIFLDTKKGALLVTGLSLVTAYFCVHGYIPKRHFMYGCIGVLFTAIFYYAVATMIRETLLAYASDPSQGLSMKLDSVDISETGFSFLRRMGAFDSLAGLMCVGRDTFYPGGNLRLDLIAGINQLIPGNLVPLPDDYYVNVARIMPHELRGITLLTEDLGGHGELLGGPGMAYVYFGEIEGPLFFLVWGWACMAVERSRWHVIAKMFLIYYFMVFVFIGSGFATPLQTLANLFYLSIPVTGFVWLGKSFRLTDARIPEHSGIRAPEVRN